MFFKKKTPQIKQNNTSKKQNGVFTTDFAQEKRLHEFKNNMKKLSQDGNSAMLLAKQLSRLIQRSK